MPGLACAPAASSGKTAAARRPVARRSSACAPARTGSRGHRPQVPATGGGDLGIGKVDKSAMGTLGGPGQPYLCPAARRTATTPTRSGIPFSARSTSANAPAQVANPGQGTDMAWNPALTLPSTFQLILPALIPRGTGGTSENTKRAHPGIFPGTNKILGYLLP